MPVAYLPPLNHQFLLVESVLSAEIKYRISQLSVTMLNCLAVLTVLVPAAAHALTWHFASKDEVTHAPHVVNTSIGRVGMMICFDWIFPETARCLALAGAQILAHATNLVMPYCQSAMLTRCIENRVFAVTANRIGEEDRAGTRIAFTGRSQITGHTGERLAQASHDGEEVISAELDPALADDKQVTPDFVECGERRL